MTRTVDGYWFEHEPTTLVLNIYHNNSVVDRDFNVPAHSATDFFDETVRRLRDESRYGLREEDIEI